jgi:hypothetical protein
VIEWIKELARCAPQQSPRGGGSLSAEEDLRLGDLALLGVDNALGELTGVGILSVAELSLGHRDSQGPGKVR